MLIMPAMVEANLWTTIPIPMTDAWINIATIDSDIQLIQTALYTKGVTLNKALLAYQGYYKPLCEGLNGSKTSCICIKPPNVHTSVVCWWFFPVFNVYSSLQCVPSLLQVTAAHKTYVRTVERYWWLVIPTLRRWHSSPWVWPLSLNKQQKTMQDKQSFKPCNVTPLLTLSSWMSGPQAIYPPNGNMQISHLFLDCMTALLKQLVSPKRILI